MTATMTPFTRVTRNPLQDMVKRQALLNQPCELFQGFFGGRVPTLEEKVRWVEQAMQQLTSAETWENNLYIVRVYHVPPFVQLDISRKDEQPRENWRHFQQIKNELIGPECEAVELFPAESRLVDTSNQYHLWVLPDARNRFPFGFPTRLVLKEPIRSEAGPGGAIRTTVTELVPLDNAAAASVGTS